MRVAAAIMDLLRRQALMRPERRQILSRGDREISQRISVNNKG
jgi:hypothetical protein